MASIAGSAAQYLSLALENHPPLAGIIAATQSGGKSL
jgi:hypothetical protein